MSTSAVREELQKFLWSGSFTIRQMHLQLRIPHDVVVRTVNHCVVEGTLIKVGHTREYNDRHGYTRVGLYTIPGNVMAEPEVIPKWLYPHVEPFRQEQILQAIQVEYI